MNSESGAAVSTQAHLRAHSVTLAYGRHIVARRLDVGIPTGAFTAVVGPNACGKSTLLRALARLHRPAGGSVLLDGQDIARLNTKEVARRVGLLPQTARTPERMTVEDLVARGRFPHQRLLSQWSDDDRAAVQRAMDLMRVSALAQRPVDELSGGQRQRAWLALVLAQDTETILLDEPTTFLDVAHQIEILELCQQLNAEGRTVVAVLHDLNQAARCAQHMIAMNAGQVYAEGAPSSVVTEDLLNDVFGLPALVVPDPVAGTPMVVPYGPLPRRTSSTATVQDSSSA